MTISNQDVIGVKSVVGSCPAQVLPGGIPLADLWKCLQLYTSSSAEVHSFASWFSFFSFLPLTSCGSAEPFLFIFLNFICSSCLEIAVKQCWVLSVKAEINMVHYTHTQS